MALLKSLKKIQTKKMNLREILATGSTDNLPSLISAVNHADAVADKLDTCGKVFFLRNFTVDLIEPYIKYRLYESGIMPVVTIGEYDTIYQELLDDKSPLHGAQPDVVVVSLVLESLDSTCRHPGWTADTVREKLQDLFDLVAEKTDSMVAVNTFVPPFYREQGIAVLAKATDAESEIHRLNHFVRMYVSNNASRFFLMDWDRFVRILGEDRSMDYRYWYMSKAPFKSEFLDLYAIEISRLVRIVNGKVKKCLVLDCDNTLWGGVVGEDGVQGIHLDPNEWPGKAFYDFQTSLLCLIERGILIALCSKNNEQDVWEILDNNKHCLLKRKHLAAWRINWDNKAANIASLAQELNLGLDSFVFVEDDSAQCELIRQTLPDVTVIQVPKHFYDFPDILHKSGLFDTLTVSEEDEKRTALYQQERKRVTNKKSFSNIDDYLASLEIQATIHKAHKHELPRIAQLTQKTNQFNLTTQRYSEPEIEALLQNPNIAIYTLGVSDRFGDLGMTGVLVARHEGNAGVIDTLLLSCRILGRDLEYTFVDYSLSELEREWDVEQWIAEYIPTRKNEQTASFWDGLGFKFLAMTAGSKKYEISSATRSGNHKSFINVLEE